LFKRFVSVYHRMHNLSPETSTQIIRDILTLVSDSLDILSNFVHKT